jgi:hypothetical protein
VFDEVLQELGASGTELVAGSIAAVAIYLAVILATRRSGLLMDGPRIVDDNLAAARITLDDVLRVVRRGAA